MSLFPRSTSRIRREASRWVVRLGQQPSAEEQAAFREWRDADRRHGDAYDRIAGIWHKAAQLSPNASAPRPGVGSAWSPAVKFALAASILAVLLASLFVLPSPYNQNISSRYAAESFVSESGKRKRLALPDGSIVTLDSGTRVEVAFSEDMRRLTLRNGRARFAVAHEGRPFIVIAGGSEIRATGTTFDVSLAGDRTAVVMIEGSVAIRQVGDRPSPRGELHLRAGEKLLLSRSDAPVRTPVDRSELAWPSRMLVFDQTPLKEAESLANRHSKVQLKLGDRSIEDLRVSGAFEEGDVPGLAGSLASAFGLRLVKDADGNLLLLPAAEAR